MSPTAQPAPQPAARCIDTDAAFCAFALELERALQIGSVEFLLAHTRVSAVNCPGTEADVYVCEDQPAGASIRRTGVYGLTVTARETYGDGAAVSLDVYRSNLARILALPQPALSDGMGDGSFRVYAHGSDPAGRRYILAAYLQAGGRRAALIFHLVRQPGSEWLIENTGSIGAGTPPPADFLAAVIATRPGASWRRWGP